MLDINVWLLVMVAFIFIFLIIVLNNILYKPLLDFMGERDESIKRDTLEAEKNSSNVSHLEEEAYKIIHDAKKEANKLKEEALSMVKNEIEKRITSKKEELEKSHEEFLLRLKDEREALREEMAKNMPQLNSALKVKLSQI